MKYLVCLLLLSSLTISGFSQKKQGLALTPPMGWNSWNVFACDIDEVKIKGIADRMVESGMKDVGYQYVIIDDCWAKSRDKNGEIVADSVTFPSGIKALADYIHSKGLKFGIYSDAGTCTCGGRPGGQNYEEIDTNTYAKWGVDYLKYDWCNVANNMRAPDLYPIMSQKLANCSRPIVFAICEWGGSKPWTWAENVGHLWRISGDIQDCWDCKTEQGFLGWTRILDLQVGLEKYAGPGHWNDPDMLEVENGGMTVNEYQAHFSFWCLLAAPLIAGNDLRNMDQPTKDILLNKDAIAINQDVLGAQGEKVQDEGDYEIWTKQLANGDRAVILFNRSETEHSFVVDWMKLSVKKNSKIYDIWSHQTIGNIKNNEKFDVPGHSVKFFRLSK